VTPSRKSLETRPVPLTGVLVAASQGVLVLSMSLPWAGTFRTCPRRACPRVWIAATTTRTRAWDAGLELEPTTIAPPTNAGRRQPRASQSAVLDAGVKSRIEDVDQQIHEQILCPESAESRER